MMIFIALLLKPVIWLTVFWTIRGDSFKHMLLWALGTTFVLTLVDRVFIAGNLPPFTIVLTLALYAVMSLTLMPLAWMMKNARYSKALNVLGVLGSFVGVNFAMDCIRTFFPMMNG
ncbi:MAG: hypothetical protein FIA91_12440 [Geobacter sp.]|nr:hypothetical protein [Geobacter sp.]